jgi:hypothetical protein
MVLSSGDSTLLSRELTERVTDDLGAKLRDLVKRRFTEDESKAPLRAVLVAPDSSRPVDGDTARLRLALRSREAGRIAALDIHRLEGASSTFRWQAPRDLLRDLAEMSPSGYVIFEVPEPIPLKLGENVLKLRVLRDDRELVSRTMVLQR